MSPEPLIRITVCVHRRPGISEDAFHRYWAYEHGPLAAEWLKRCGVLKYVQYHTTTEHKNLAKKMSDAVGRPVLDWDGMADFYVRRYEDFEAAFLDAEYLERIRPDEVKLMNMESIRLTVGVEFVCIDDGELVKEHERTF
ncbi:ethD domain-containing protein [Sarocladium implicatum]|nr:ethD domain-containing protein [Sarocladium implicatum]